MKKREKKPMIALRARGVLALALISSAVSAQVISRRPEVRVNYDRHFAFSMLSSYDWSRFQQPAKNLANHIRLTRAIQKELKEMGFSIDPVKPAVQVLYHLEVKTKIGLESSFGGYPVDPTNQRTNMPFRRRKEETLTIEMIQTETHVTIWRASLAQPAGTPDKAERRINAAVHRIFEEYPLRKEEKN